MSQQDVPQDDVTGEESDLYRTITAEQEARVQRDLARRALYERTQELRVLMGQSKEFNSRTSVEEVMAFQARAEALRWLITCIEREIRELNEVCNEKAQEILVLTGQLDEKSDSIRRHWSKARQVAISGD
jgi:hypothetical protein